MTSLIVQMAYFSYNDISPLRSLNPIFDKKETSSYLDTPEQDVHFTEM